MAEKFNYIFVAGCRGGKRPFIIISRRLAMV